jgi:hypothetical protein
VIKTSKFVLLNLHNVKRLPPFWSFNQLEVYKRKPNTIEDVMEIVEEIYTQHDVRKIGQV